MSLNRRLGQLAWFVQRNNRRESGAQALERGSKEVTFAREGPYGALLEDQ